MSEHKRITVEALLNVWDGFGYDDGAVLRPSVQALVEAAYTAGAVEALSPSVSVPSSLAEQGRQIIAEADANIAQQKASGSALQSPPFPFNPPPPGDKTE